MHDIDFFNKQDLCKVIMEKLAVTPPKDYRCMTVIRKQDIDFKDFGYIGFQNTRKNDNRSNSNKTVGFFLQDRKFECVCRKPWKYVSRLLQYKQTMSPDISCYTDMPLQDQWRNTFLNRVIGAYWQHCGLTVIPTIAWSDRRSHEFFSAGVEKGCVVAVSTIGTKKNRPLFMDGFAEMCRRIKPEVVICYCTPYIEMYKYADIISIEYEGRRAWRKAKYRPDPNQLLFNFDCFKEGM